MTNPTTVVSGYWDCTNKHGNKFASWFENTLLVNCPYVFFGTADTIASVKRIRRGLPTHCVELELADFHTRLYASDFVVHSVHCPSTDLNMIWNEKLFLMQRAARLNPFGSEWFAWVDAGICTYRTSPPPPATWPAQSKMRHLPKSKVIFTTSRSPLFSRYLASGKRYYHCITGGAYLVHDSLLDHFVTLYDSYLSRYVPTRATTYTDQVILTLLYKDRPDLFHRLGHGYGAALPLLYDIPPHHFEGTTFLERAGRWCGFRLL